MKKEDKKVIFTIIGLVVLQLILYSIAKLTPFNYHIVNISLDDKIPFIKYFIYPYITWYIMIFIIPFIFYKYSNKYFNVYKNTIIIALIISFIIYLFYPTTLTREMIVVTDLSTFLIKLIYEIDTPAINCLPSIHCFISFIFIYIAFSIKDMKSWLKVIIIVLSILVILATLFIKQHVLLDVVSSFILSLIIYILIKKKTEN